MTNPQVAESRHRTWALFALAGSGTLLVLWLVLVPAHPTSSSRFLIGIVAAVVVAATVGGGVSYVDRTAGQAFAVAAFLTTLVLFSVRSIAAEDVLWVVGLLLIGLGALGAFVTAFALGRLLRTGSAGD